MTRGWPKWSKCVISALTETEIAQALEVTDRTVRRDWEKARLWLSNALK
jgi:hypothetical protein